MKKGRILMALWMGLVCAQAQAQNVWWDVCDADWFTPDNWIPGVPDCSSTVYIDNGCGGPRIIDAGAQGGIVYVGFDEVGNTLEITGASGSLNVCQQLRIGEFEGSEGTVTLSGMGQLSAASETVGVYGTGTFTQNGGVNNVTGTLVVGRSPGSRGEYQLNAGVLTSGMVRLGLEEGMGVFRQKGGTVTTGGVELNGDDTLYELSAGLLSNGGTMIRGCRGSPYFLQAGGTHITGSSLQITCRGEDAGTYELTGGELSVGGDLLIGGDPSGWCYQPLGPAVGTFVHSGGVNTINGSAQIAWRFDGLYELTGTGRLFVAGDEILGWRSTGTIVQTGGTNTVAKNLTIGGPGSCSIGRYELSGTGELFVGGEETLGNDSVCSESRGDFIQSGGTHTVATLKIGNIGGGGYVQSGGTNTVETFLYLGHNPNVKGTYKISGGGLSAMKAWVGYEGTGEFTHTGGEVVFNDLELGKLGGGTGAYQISGEAVLVVEDQLYVGRSGTGGLTLGGGTLTADMMFVGKLSGAGSVAITNASTNVTIGKELTLGRNASFFAEPASVIHMTRSADGTVAAKFDNLSTSPFSLLGLANVELSFEGGADLTSTVEVGGSDLGAVESGFVGNFSLGTLRVGTSETAASVQLVDARDNGNRGPGSEPEALYVCTIAVSAGSTFDLNGLNAYYRSLVDDGGTIELNDGTLEQVGLDDDGDGDVDLADFARFQVCFSGPNDAPGYSEPSWQCTQTFDQDCDGDVDSFDFRVFFVGFDGP